MALDDIQLNIVVNLQGDSKIDGYNRKVQNLTRAHDEVVRTQDAITAVNRKTLRSWEDLRQGLDVVERKYDALFRAGVHMTQMGHDLIGVSERLLRLGMGVVDAVDEYDFTFRRAAVALNVTKNMQEALNDAIVDSSIALGVFKPEEVAQAYYRWGAASGVAIKSQKDLAIVTETVEKILTATAMAGGSLEGNILGVYSVLSQFNMEADKAGYVTEVLALMTERTAADFGDLTNSLSYLGPLADTIGISFEDVAQILGVLADAGQRGSRAGRGLAMVIEGISAPSGPAKEALDGLIQRTHGLQSSWEEVIFPEGEFVGLRDMIQEVALAAENMTDAERGRFFATALSNNATRALIPLINEQILLNKEAAKTGAEWTSVLDQEKYSLDTAAEFFNNMSESMRGSIKAVVGSLQNSFFPILQLVAARIMEMAEPVMERIKGMADAFHAWLQQNPELVKLAVHIGALMAVVAGVAGAFFLVSGTITLLMASLGVVTEGIGRVIAPFAALALVIGAIVTAVLTNFGGIRDAIEDVASALGDFFDALGVDFDMSSLLSNLWALAEPVLEQGVRALADGLHWLAEKIRELTGNTEFMGWAQEAAGWIAGIVTASLGLRVASSMFGMLGGSLWALGVLWQGAKKLLMAGPIMGLAKTLVGVATGLGSAFMALSTPIKLLVGGLSIVGLAIAGAFLAYETNFLGFRDFVNGIVQWLVTNVPGVINTVIGFFQQVAGTIASVWQTVWAVVGPILEAFIAPFVRLATHGIPALITKLQEFWATVAPIFMSIRDTIVEVFTNVVIPAWDSLTSKVGEFFATVVPILTEFVGHIVGVAQFIIEGFFFPLVHWWDEIVTIVGVAVGILLNIVMVFLETVLSVIGPWVEAGIRIFGVLWETVTGIFGAALDVIMGVVKTVFGTINEIFKAFAKLFSGDVEGFLDGISTAFWTAVDGILTIIGGLVSGIWTAFTGMVATVWELVTGFLRGIVGLFPDFVQDWIDAGGDAVRGLWEGITGLARWVWDKLSGFVGDIVDKVKGFFGIHSPSTVFADMGKAIVRGLWNGISGLAGWLWDKVSSWVGGIVDNVLGFFGIESPSKVFADIGQNLVKGMAVGIDATPDAVRSMDRYAQQILDIGSSMESASAGFTTEFDTRAGLSVESKDEKTIRVELDLTSSDGSYDDATLEQLKTALTGSDLVRALERMAEAG